MQLTSLRLLPAALLCALASAAAPASAQTITTVLGSFKGDGGPATSAHILNPITVKVDAAGNRYILADWRVRKVTPEGIITTVAGTGESGYGGAGGYVGDGGPATQAPLKAPTDIALDSAGNLYIADSMRIRKVDRNGIITSIAGKEYLNNSGDGGPATQAELSAPQGLAVDANGNLFLTDSGSRLRKIDSKGIINNFAGNGLHGYSGDGGMAVNAWLQSPIGITSDAAGNVYFADSFNGRVRRVSTTGIITTVAGSGRYGYPQSGVQATSLQTTRPHGVAVDSSGNLFFSDNPSDRIVRISTNGTSTVVGGDGTLKSPSGMSVDAAGNLFFADTGNHRIGKLTPLGVVVTDAGRASLDGGAKPASQARIYQPISVDFDSAGNLYVADLASHQIRKMAPDGTVTVLAGTGAATFSGDGALATDAALNYPVDVAADRSGNVYIADAANRRIRKVSAAGVITTFAGNGGSTSSGDGGPATGASFGSDGPQGVGVDADGNVYVADLTGNRIRKITSAGVITTVAGTGSGGFDGDGGPATSAKLSGPLDVAADGAGNLYILDAGNYRIRKVTPAGIISTIAGNGFGGMDDGAQATSGGLLISYALAVDTAGNVYLAESQGDRIRKIDTKGIITTVAGVGYNGFAGDAGPARNATFSSPQSVAVDKSGNVYVADTGNARIRKVAISNNYQGVWMGGATENGWGLSLVQHGDTLVAGWYYYDGARRATWTIMPGCTWNAAFTSCTGTLYNAVGARFDNYTTTGFSQTAVGTMTFAFTDTDHGTMTYTVNGVSGQKSISRFNFAAGTRPYLYDNSDIWWGGQSQNGWGLALVQQLGEMVGAWYTYDAQGRPTWFLINGGSWLSVNVFKGNLTRATGSPMLGTTYNASLFTPTVAGTILIGFDGPDKGLITYTVDGITQQKLISRLVF